MMKKSMLLIVVIVIALTGASDAGEVISGCGGIAYPPFMWKEGERIVGVGPEIAEIIFGELGFKVESRAFSSWSRCMQEVKKGRTDILFAASVNDERSKFADFTEICLSEVPVAIFVWKERGFKFEKWEDLTGKKMGKILGTTYGQKFDAFVENHLNVSRVVKPIQNFKRLEKGRVDFLPIGLYAGRIQVKEFGYEGP